MYQTPGVFVINTNDERSFVTQTFVYVADLSNFANPTLDYVDIIS